MYDACTVTDTETSPFIIDEENGIVYSPSSRRADTMAQRLREMREQRENLSPTGMSTGFFLSDAFRSVLCCAFFPLMFRVFGSREFS